MNEMLNHLFESLQKRLRPEDIAELILVELKHDLSEQEKGTLKRATTNSLKKLWYQFTSMSQDFHRPVSPIRQANKACELFSTVYKLSDKECTDLEKVNSLVKHISQEILKSVGGNSFKSDRLNNEMRQQKGLEVSRRRYNKLFRFLVRFEKKIETYRMELRKYEATRIAKSSLAMHICYEDFIASRDAACFIAYFTARRNRRSVFTNQSQDRAFDEVSEMLLNRFKKNPCAEGWRTISYVMPDAEIVSNLSDKDKINLFAKWLLVLSEIAELLELTWEKSKFNRETMIVNRGDDSSTWNALAGAWNSARQGWLSVIHSLGMEAELEELCFGKVMRLMAADVAAWHRLSGGRLEPDTLVWAELPPPWEVFSGKAKCTRQMVEDVCNKHNVDPIKKGWTFPQHQRQAVPFQPTPELVHGVIVSNPKLALVLRKAGWFSGKRAETINLEEGITVHGDALGFVLNVTSEEEINS